MTIIDAPLPSASSMKLPRLAAAVLAIAASGLAVVALSANINYTSGLGQSVAAAGLLASLGGSIDLLAMVLPSIASEFFRRRHFVACLFSSAIWIVAVSWTVLAVASFSATNIEDAFAGRDKISDQSVSTKSHLAQMRAERSAITETRSPATIELEMQRAWPRIPKSTRTDTKDCRSVTLPASLALCDPIMKLREAQDIAQRRDDLDRQIRTDEAQLFSAPAISQSDPGATTAAELISFMSAGALQLTAATVQKLRIACLALMPTFSGILYGLALLLFRGRSHA